MTSCAVQDDNSNEKNRLLNTDRQFAALSLERGAAEAFRHYLTEDAMSLSDGYHPVLGGEAIYESMRLGQGKSTLAWDPQRAEVASAGDMGWTWGVFTLTFSDSAGIEQTQYGKYINIWERQGDGQWRVAVDMGNTSPAPTRHDNDS